MFALRLARAATGRDAVLKFEGGFHGNNDYALMSLTPQRALAFPVAEPSSAGIPAVLEAEVLIAPFNDVDTTRAIVEQYAGRLAAIIVEPVQRAIIPAPGFLESLRTLADHHGIVLVFDEVVTGFRLALGGAQEFYGVVPDLAAYGKILGGGYPLAAVAGRREIMDGAAQGTYVSGTLSGNPVASAAGLATLKVLSENGGFDHLHHLGARMRAGVEDALRRNGHVARVIGVGPVFQICFRESPPTDYRQAKDAAAAPLQRLTSYLLEHGIFYTGKKGYLSLVHTEEDVDRVIELIGDWACRDGVAA
jgi:glutamate-1-semialdehyde 2,1-aminomutase